jgi:hypothetical protein
VYDELPAPKKKEKIETVRDLYYEKAVQIKLEAEL